jgi:hypothetical protein
MANPRYSIHLVNSSDLSGVADLTQRAHDKQLTVGLNKGGSFSFTVPLEESALASVVPVATAVVVRKDDQVVWSGPIWTMEETVPESQMNVGCVGWQTILEKRVFDADVTYTTTNFGTIVHNLLALANAQQATWITAGNNGYAGFTITKSYKKYETIGAAITQLTEVENGPDIYVRPEERDLVTYNQRMTDQTDVEFSYGVGRYNVATLSRTTDADQMYNRVYAIGANAAAQANDTGAQSTYRLSTRVDNLSTNAETAILAAYANAEVAVNATPRVLVTFTPVPVNTESIDVPSIFVDYDIGDKIYLSAQWGSTIDIQRQAIRIFGAQVTIDDEGNEFVSGIQTTFS